MEIHLTNILPSSSTSGINNLYNLMFYSVSDIVRNTWAKGMQCLRTHSTLQKKIITTILW